MEKDGGVGWLSGKGGRYGRTTQFTLGKLAAAIEAVTFPKFDAREKVIKREQPAKLD
jgi:hypothetical protein